MLLRPGHRLGDREIRQVIASRRMGAVYRALYSDTDEVVRTLAPDLIPQALSLLEPIRQALAGGEHIVQMRQIARASNDLAYIAMEALDPSLRDQIGASPRGLPFETCVTFMRQATDGLAYAHERGYRHGRLKPENLLLRKIDAYDDQILLKIGDFGMAELAGEYALTAAATARYTDLTERRRLLAYAAPEQLLGERVTSLADIYALGVILYELVTGTLPFEVNEHADALYQHTLMAPRPPRELRSGVPADLELIILKCLAKYPQARFASARDLADRLGTLPLPRTYQLRPHGGGPPLLLPPGRYLLAELQDGSLDLAEDSAGRPYATITAAHETVTVEVSKRTGTAARLGKHTLQPERPERWQTDQELQVERHKLALEKQHAEQRARSLGLTASVSRVSRYQLQEQDTIVRLFLTNPLERRASYRLVCSGPMAAWVNLEGLRAEGAVPGIPQAANGTGQSGEVSLPVTIQGAQATLDVPLNPRYAAVSKKWDVGDDYRLFVRLEDVNGQFVPGNCTLACSILPRVPLLIKQITLDDVVIYPSVAVDTRRPALENDTGVIVPRLMLAAGSTRACTVHLRVQNLAIGDYFQIEIDGVPPGWCRPAVRAFRYTPGDKAIAQEGESPETLPDRAIMFTFSVPGGESGLAGEYPVVIKFIAESMPAVMTRVFMIWQIPPIYDQVATLSTELERASRNRATYAVTITNRGNAACWYMLRCTDGLDLHRARPWLKFDQPLVCVPPGETLTTRLKLEALPRPLGATQKYEFTVQAALMNQDAPRQPALVASCTFDDHPMLQIDSIQRTVLAVVMIFGFVALGLYIFERVMTMNTVP